jgi:spore maturation protein CgeB
MRLVVFGLSVTSAWGNGHATLWRGLLRALVEMGHDVVFFERDTPFYAAHRDMPCGDGYEVVVYPDWPSVVGSARAELERADVAIVTSYQADAEWANDLVLGSRALRIFYDLDTPVTLLQAARGERVPWIPTAGLGGFDLVLSYTGGSSLDGLGRLGARKTETLYGSVDRTTHRPCDGRRAWSCDLSYLGTYAADRQDTVERLLLDVAERVPTSRFILGGPMYPASMRRPRNLVCESHVAPGEHPAFYGSSRCTLNVTRAVMRDAGYCPSARLFEAAACGVPIVTDAWEGLELFFEPESEILVATSADDVVEVLTLGRGDLEALARRARERTLDEHTAERRAAELVGFIER